MADTRGWDYKVIETDVDRKGTVADFEKRLQQLGDDGWEAIASVTVRRQQILTPALILKRPKLATS
jgi:hypothetical protein